MNTVIVLIKEKPEDSNYIAGGYCRVSPTEALSLINEGYAVGYDPESKEEINPFLPDEYPNKDILYKAGIYTEEQLEKSLKFASELTGIGKKTLDTYKELLSPTAPADEPQEESTEEDG